MIPKKKESWMRRWYRFLSLAGFDPYHFIGSLRALPVYIRNYREIRRMMRLHPHPEFPITKLYPMLHERNSPNGRVKGAYFHQDLLIARRVFENRPERHVDIGSRIDGFVAHVASFRDIEVIDIRNLTMQSHRITFRQGDFMREDFPLVDYCDSASCLHTIEHFGLGRFGDPLDFDGHLKGFRNLHRIVKTGGKLYLSTPIGPQRIEFDAHRVFALAYLLDMVKPAFRVDQFSYVDDDGDLHENVELTKERIAANCDCTLGCGIFEMTKIG